MALIRFGVGFASDVVGYLFTAVVVMSPPPFFCCSIPDLALQVLRRQEQGDGRRPLLVINADRPGGRVLELNLPAQELGVRRGMRYSEALSLSEKVTAGVVSSELRQRAVEEIRTLLQTFLPTLEMWTLAGYVFWSDLRGMGRMGGGSVSWLTRIVDLLEQAGWNCGIATGWTRAGTYMAAERAWKNRCRRDNGEELPAEVLAPRVFHDRQAEETWFMRQGLDCLPLHQQDRERLRLLGIQRVSNLLALEEPSLRGRFSKTLVELHRFLRGKQDGVPAGDTTVQKIPFSASRRYEPPLGSTGVVLASLKRLTDGVLASVKEQGEWVRGITVVFADDTGKTVREDIHCGHLTRDGNYLERLLALRLENSRWSIREIAGIELVLQTDQLPLQQGQLRGLLPDDETTSFPGMSSPEAARRIGETVSLLQARLGDRRVFQLVIKPARLPEHRFSREPVEVSGMVCPENKDTDVFSGGLPDRLLSIREVLINGPRPLRKTVPPVRYGPFVQATEWWNGDEADRIYTYHQDRTGRVLWLYRAVDQGPWMVQGWLA